MLESGRAETNLKRHTPVDSSDTFNKLVEFTNLSSEYNIFFDNALTGLYITQNGNIVRCNACFARMFEYSIDQLIGKKVHEVLRTKNGSEFSNTRCFEDKNKDQIVQIIKTHTRTGNTIWVKYTEKNIDTVRGNMRLGNVIDVTEQVKVENLLSETEKELRLLSEQLINAQEKERKRVASELHDGICQSLSSLKYKVEQSTNVCGGMNCEIDSIKQFVVSKVQNIIEEVRGISMDLRPSILDDLGLLETIEWQLREFQLTHKHIDVKKYINIREGCIPEKLKISLFRILQEALSNISKHADAKSIKVSLSLRKKKICLVIEDNGKGVELATLQHQSPHGNRIGLGLKSMQERAKLTGGAFEFTSLIPTGTCIHVQWPVR